MQQVVVYGAGGNGREVAAAIRAMHTAGAPLELIGFVDDAPTLAGTTVQGLEVLGSVEWIGRHQEVGVVLGLGHPRHRQSAQRKVAAAGGTWTTIIHPRAIVSPSAEVGAGSVVFAGAIISEDCRVGDLVQVSFNAVVHHDTHVADLACVMAHVTLAGNVRVGMGAFIGIGACVRQGVSIGDWSIIGAGAAVVRDIPSCCVALGVPARSVRTYAGPEEMPPF